MSESISVGFVVPWREQPSRIESFDRVNNHYSDFLKDKELLLVDSGSETFSRAQSINIGMKHFFDKGFDIVVVNDADVLSDVSSLESAIIKAHQLQRSFIPYNKYVIFGERNFSFQTFPSEGESAEGLSPCSGTNVIPRQVYENIGGFDENFIGWGLEDQEYHYRYFLHYGEKYRIESGKTKSLYHKRVSIDKQVLDNHIYAHEKYPESVALKNAYLSLLEWINEHPNEYLA
jgi:hypothetical protein